MDTLQTVESIPPPPTCGFTFSPLGPVFTYTINSVVYPSNTVHETFTNTDITFTSWVVTPPGVAILTYSWDFGDGNQAVGEIVHHTYIMATPQTRVSFCVTDNFRRQVCVGQLLNLRPGVPITVGAYIVRGP
jgi:hypothetical protein